MEILFADKDLERLSSEERQIRRVSAPGETIEDLLEEQGWTQAEFADRTGFTRKHVNDLVKGRATITPDAALRLEAVLGASADFWLTREAHYREALERRRSRP